MFNVASLISTFWPPIVLLVLVVAVALVVEFFKESKNTEGPSIYEKKPFVFDAMSELTLYRLLVEIVGDKFYVFPQVGYGHLVQLKKGAERINRSRFDKKTADFVLCDKERGVAQLVIELDGASHHAEKRIERDERVDAMMKQIGLPILHLKTGNMDKEYIKGEVEKALASN